MLVLYIVLGVVAVLVLLMLFLISPSVRPHSDKKVIKGLYIAHRGLHGIMQNTPENSLPAFRQAVELGFAIENDIHLTKDKEVVVFHDDTLKRVCGVEGRVEDKTLAELKGLRLLGTDCQIPTLRECLEVVDGKVPLLIEFKCVSLKCDELCEAADKILSEYKGRYFIQSFCPMVLRWYKKHRSTVCRGQLASEFKGQELYKGLLGCLMFNFIGRPHFVSYEHKYHKNIFRHIVTGLGAQPVGWTFESQTDIDRNGKCFDAYIFEKFIPKH